MEYINYWCAPQGSLERNFRCERGCGGRTSFMFTKTRGECNSTSGRKFYQVDPVPGKYGQLYRHTEFYACHSYGHFSDQCPDKKRKQLILK